MAQTKPKAAQFYGVSNNGTAGQVLTSDGNGGMSWGSNTEQFTVSWATPTGQSLTYTQPSPQSSTGVSGDSFPTTTFTATKSGEAISGTATIAGLPTGITASQSISGSGIGNVLTVTLAGVFPGADSLNTALTISGLTVAVPLTVKYLVIAGGASGGQMGGGGAGGYLTNYTGTALTLSQATAYTVTVGGGGAGSNNSIGSDGSNSIFSSIESTGGGGGAGQGAATANGFGRPGGSGGGAGKNDAGGGAGGAASPSGQGNAGGNYGGSIVVGGGGGGAGAAGVNGSGSNPGNGGIGLTNAITVASGTGPYYTGGGGGGAYPPGVAAIGGSGGGGNGGYSGQTATSATNNTGGGGGAPGLTSSGNLNGASGNGGSGIVILRYSNSFTISGLSGTTITVGTDKITTFNSGTGNIQFN